MNNLTLRVNKQPWWDNFEFLLVDKSFDRIAYGASVTMQTIDPMSSVSYGPTFHMTYDACQRLMDELWNCGLRPSEGTGSAGALAATQKHLEDIRSINAVLLMKALRD